MTASSPDLARDRYGRRKAWPRRRLVALAGGLLVAALAWVAWVAVRVGSPEVSFQDVGYQVISDGAAQVTFDVTFAGRVAPSRRAVCTLQAQNELHSEVGLLDAEVGPAGDRHQRVTRQLPTSERATTVVVKACALH